MDLKDFFTVRKAAVEIGIEYGALYMRIVRGKVAVHPVGDHIKLIHKDEVARLKKEQEAC